MIDTDVTGRPCGPREETHTEWAVLVDAEVGGVAGPHLLVSEPGELHARRRLWWWQHKRPDANPRLMRQEVVTRFGPWTVADDQRTEEIW